ncbi:MAG: TRAP transporter substrate-binding protein [Alphaproteobacteria bacterium]|nr:TRAP transporter substrate-binding protein [Alphaproteobacteria bacterium]
MFTRRRVVRGLAASVVAAPAVLRSGAARAQQVTLRMHHFLPPVSNGHAKFLAPWAKKVETESNGLIKIDIFPSMQLGGTPPQLYDQARDGVADLVWTLPGYTAGRFPRIETIELPFVAHKRAVVNSLALQEFAGKHLAEEFKEVHPVCFWAHDHGLIHTSAKQVKTMEDLKGLKLRFPTRLAGEALKALGVVAIGMPVPQVPESLAQRVIDGCVVPWEVVPAIKVQELCKFHAEIPGSPTFYSATFVLVMNKAKYQALSPEAKKAIDANSGMAAAKMAGTVWDEAAVVVKDMVQKRGNTITVIAEDEVKRWQATTKPVVDAWLAASKEKGFDGAALLADLQALIQKHGKA